MNTGYLKYFGVLLCLFAVAALLPPASADTATIYKTLQTPSGLPWVKNVNESSMTCAAICTVYGKTPQYAPGSGYTESNYVFYGTQAYTATTSETTSLSIPGGFVDTYNPYLTLTDGVGPTYISVGRTCPCNDTKWYTSVVHHYYNSTVYLPPPVCNFTATPLSGTVPLTVSFTDTTTNVTGSDTWNWSVSPAPGVSITTPAAQNTQMTFATVGNYTITHGVSNTAGSSIATKTDYIYVYNSTAVTTLHVTAINALNAYPIHGAQVNLYDVENTSWSNTTTSDGTGTITALSTHTINAYANAAGFLDNDKLRDTRIKCL